MFTFATCEFVKTYEVMVVFVKHQITAMCFIKSFISTASTVLVFYNFPIIIDNCRRLEQLSRLS